MLTNMSAIGIAEEGSIPSTFKSQDLMAFCSVCLDAVVEGEGRSIAMLKCGHHFHLDCIGSAFNAKGRMQCPNCRQVEQGRWLYANVCCLNEDFVEDLSFEEDAEAYSAAAELFSHTPWCPHQASFGPFLLTFEELNNFANGYLDLPQNVVHGLQAPAISGGHICPYLVGAQNVHLGTPSNHIENFLALHADYLDGASNHSRMRDASHGQRTRLALPASNGSWTSYGGPSQSYTHNGPFLQPNFRHRTFGFLMESTQSAHAGFSQGTNHGGLSNQLLHSQIDQRMYRNAHPHPTSLSRSGQTNTRRTRHGDASRNSRRISHISPSERAQINEPVHGYHSWAGLYPAGQSPSQVLPVDGVNRMSGSSHREVSYPHISYGMPAHWWAWVPPETNHIQRAVRNMAPYAYYEGQFNNASRPTPSMARFSERTSEGPYTWVFSGFQ